MVLLIAALVAVVGGVTASQRTQQEASLIQAWSANSGTSPSFVRQEQALRVRALPSTAGAVSYFRLGDDSAPAVPQTRTTVVSYTTRPGDSTYAIAVRYGVTVQSIVWANQLDDADNLPIGSTIVIPPTTGVLHTVLPGETLFGLAANFNVDASAILAFTPNGITDPNLLPIGRRVMIPGGVVPPPPPPALPISQPAPVVLPRPAVAVAQTGSAQAAAAQAVAAVSTPAPVVVTGNFAWPTFGPIFQYFGSPTDYGYHEGIDISPPWGTPVYASDGGVVVDEQRLTWSYGWFIMIDHGNGFRTRYAHMSSFAVGPGQRVGKGQQIGAVGATGNATGPHLHFEIILGNTPVNPLKYLH